MPSLGLMELMPWRWLGTWPMRHRTKYIKKTVDRHFAKEEIAMTNKYLKIFLTL